METQLKLLFLLILLTLGLSVWISAWFLPLTLLLALMWARTRFLYVGRPWRKVHFPMMRAHARAFGREVAQARDDGREVNFLNVMELMLTDVNPKMDIPFNEVIARELERCSTFSDRKMLVEYLSANGVDHEAAQDTLDGMEAALLDCVALETGPPRALFTRMIIAAIIESQFSSGDRAEYLMEVFRGHAH